MAPRIVPFAALIVLLALETPLAGLVEGTFDPRWLYGVRTGVTVLLLLAFWRSYEELRTAPSSALPWLAGLAVGAVVFGAWIALDVPFLTVGEPDPYVPTGTDGRILPGLAIVRLAGAALLVPVVEELFWRSFLMRWVHHPRFLAVDPRAVGLKALLASSVVFALEHRLWFAGLLAGLAYGELYRRSRSLWVVILAHAVTNGLLGWYVLATRSWDFW